MTFGMIFKRIWREWRLLLILLFAVSLITGFFALGPLFIRSVTEVDLRYALDNTNEDDLRITLISDTPLTSEEQDIVEDELGALVTGVNRYVRGQYTPPISAANQAPGVAGTALCGYRFLLGVNPFMGVASTPNCYQPFAFQVNDFEQRITVVEGRLPERGPTPAMLDTAGLTDEQQQELQLGLYNRSEIEAVVTREVAEEADLEIGSRFFLGNINLQGEGAVTRLKVVGIVEVNNPNDSFWQGNQMFVQGALIDTSPFTQRYDYGLAVHPAAYEDWITPILPAGVGTSYIWRMDVDTDEITSINAQDYSEAIVALGNRLNQGGRQVQVTTGLISLLGGYDKRIEDAEGPIILLSGAILVLMLYHLITTVSLVLQQQGTEWSTISSRGGSTMQLFKLQSVTILVLVVIAVILSPFLSQGFMRLMESTGPLAQALDGADLSNVTLPSLSIWLSVAAAIACLIVLSVPAIPAARRSLLLLKQATSRPPTTPAWARYWLDLAFVLLGVALMFRLYWTIADEDEGIGQLITNVFTSPRDVVELVADRASQTDGLTDPFNLLAPALVLTGFALLWLRLFPWIMKLISRYTSRSDSLTTPLAVWNVERDPGHYAQLVLLLIGTLALGTASLGLSETRDVGGWESARQETGGTARADLDLAAGRYEETAWGSLDGVTGATPVLNLSGNTFQDKSGTINVVAVSPDEFADTFPEYAELVSELDADSLASAGIPLPEEATSLQVQVWSEALGVGGLPEASVLLHAYLIDAKGLPFRIEMSQPSSVGDTASVAGQGQDSGDIRLPTPPEQWITLSGQLPPRGTAPYRLWRVGLATTQGDIEQFAHTIYLDYWQTVDVNGTATILDDQENSDLWSDQAYAIPYPGEWQNQEVLRRPVRGIDNLRFASDIPVFDGDTALQLDYTIGGVVGRNEPSIGINVNLMPRIPVIVSDDFASEFKENTAGSLTSRTPALEVGGVRDIQLNLKTGVVSLGLQAVDIVDEFPTLSEDINERYFIIMPLSTARAVVNQRLLNQTAPAEVADINQVWFELDERKPADEFQAALRNTASVEEATFAWDRFGEILREPLPSAVAGMLFAGFWVSLILSLLDFAFYIAVTAKQRAFSFGVLRSLGWDANNIWRMLLVEQISLVTPALLIGTLLGAALAYLLLPFLELVGESTLQLPYLSVGGMLLVLVAGFTLLLVLTAFWLRRMSVNQVLRLGEE